LKNGARVAFSAVASKVAMAGLLTRIDVAVNTELSAYRKPVHPSP